MKALGQACLDLIKLYEQATGQKFKRDYHVDPRDGGELYSPGAKFVSACAEVLFGDDATTENINTAMKNASRKRAELSEITPE